MTNNFPDQMSKRTDVELLRILNEQRNDYNPEAIIAAEEELAKRNLSQEQVITAKQELETKKQFDEKRANDPLGVVAKRNLFLIFLGFFFLNIICTFIMNKVSNTGAYHLNGEYVEANSHELLVTSLLAITISFPIICLLIALITTLFINREQPYKKRYLKGYLLTLIVVNAILLMGSVYRIISSQ